MRKRIKNINLLLMWLIGLMFFTHAVIPHQHHFDSIYEHNQHGSTHNSEPHEESPLHCHAFNDLIIYKTVSFSNITASPVLTAIVVENCLHLQLIENSTEDITNSLQDKLPSKETLLKNTPTRGSPSLV